MRARHALSIVVLAVLAAAAPAQFVHYPDDNTPPNAATPGGWYPWFTNATGVRYQIRIPATAFAAVPLPINLTSIGFVLGTTNTGVAATYSLMQFRLGPSAVAALTNTFATNLLPGTETLVADASGQTYQPQVTTGVWIDIPFPAVFPYGGGDLILDVQSQIPSGGAYHRSAVSSLVPRLTNTAYTGSQTTGTLGSSSGVKVRFGWTTSGPPEFQVNQPGASLAINGVAGNVVAPATVAITIGQPAAAVLASSNLGLPWEVGLGLAPLVPRSAGGLSLADGQVVNLDITDPFLTLLWNFFQSPPFTPLALAYPTGGASTLSLQMLVVDPAQASGLSCSQPNRVTVL